MDRPTLEARVDELRREHPERTDFIAAVRAFSESLDEDGRRLLERKPESGGGFDVLDQRLEQGGWMKRTMRKYEERGREGKQ
jgi:hypothetical protein